MDRISADIQLFLSLLTSLLPFQIMPFQITVTMAASSKAFVLTPAQYVQAIPYCKLELCSDVQRGTKSKAVECYTGATRPTNERSNGKKIHTAPELHPLAASLIPAMSPTDEQLQALQTVRQEHEKQMGVLKAERQVILERIQKARLFNVQQDDLIPLFGLIKVTYWVGTLL